MNFGAQGQAQAQTCAFHLCTICRAPIRLHYAVIGLLMYRMIQVFRGVGKYTGSMLIWEMLQLFGSVVLLQLTVLCHEFGHGTMARRLGGEIQFILLWPFGGICFSSRGSRDHAWDLMKDDLKVVAAGPSTHFPQVAFWGLILVGLYYILGAENFPYANPFEAFLNALNPVGNLGSGTICHRNYEGNYENFWSCLLWTLVGSAIQLNVFLFIFNVFFPMYPADGSKLLVTILMFCGMPARRAAVVLMFVGTTLAIVFICYSLWVLIAPNFQGQGWYGLNMIGSFSGLLGVMCLYEMYQIKQLYDAKRLHQHSLFYIARSWNRAQRDERYGGVVHGINQSDQDDDDGTALLPPGQRCSFSNFCPCGKGNPRQAEADWQAGPATGPANAAEAARLREARADHLARLEQRNQQ